MLLAGLVTSSRPGRGSPGLTGPGASPRAAPELPGWLPASRARLGNTTTMIPLVTAGQQTVTNMLLGLGPCDSDSNSLLMVSCVRTLDTGDHDGDMMSAAGVEPLQGAQC